MLWRWNPLEFSGGLKQKRDTEYVVVNDYSNYWKKKTTHNNAVWQKGGGSIYPELDEIVFAQTRDLHRSGIRKLFGQYKIFQDFKFPQM